MITAEQFLEILAEADLTYELLERQDLAIRGVREAIAWLPEQAGRQREDLGRAAGCLGDCNLALRDHLLGPRGKGGGPGFVAGRGAGARPAEAYRALTMDLRGQVRLLRERIRGLQEVVLKHVGVQVGADVRRLESQLTALLEKPEVRDAALQD